MSKINELIQELCPDGVEYKTLSDLGYFYGGLTGKDKTSFVDGDGFYVTYKNIFSNLSVDMATLEGVSVLPGEKQNQVHCGDILFTGSSETPNECGMSSVMMEEPAFPVYLNSFSFGLRLNDSSLLLPGFSKYVFRSACVRKQIFKTANGVTRYNVSKKLFGKVKIPVPPMEIQEEIVRILDSFTELEKELEKELTLRQKQFVYYLDYLYDRLKAESESTKMSEIGTFVRGKRFVRTDIKMEGVPCIHYGDMYTHYGISATKSKSFLDYETADKLRFAHYSDVVIVGAGENNVDIGIGVAWLGNEPVVIHDACFTFSHNENPKFISYFLRSTDYHRQLKRFVTEGKICSVSAKGLENIEIPLPAKSRQDEVVEYLDPFYELLNDDICGLTNAKEKVHKQYEYYRDKLLTFKEKVS